MPHQPRLVAFLGEQVELCVRTFRTPCVVLASRRPWGIADTNIELSQRRAEALIPRCVRRSTPRPGTRPPLTNPSFATCGRIPALEQARAPPAGVSLHTPSHRGSASVGRQTVLRHGKLPRLASSWPPQLGPVSPYVEMKLERSRAHDLRRWLAVIAIQSETRLVLPRTPRVAVLDVSPPQPLRACLAWLAERNHT
jgi:hypothetical protein